MNFCKDHWNELRSAIDARGLTKFVAPNGAEAARRLKIYQEKGASKETFEPLIEANLRIVANAVSCGGEYILTGPYCPLCELKRNGGDPADWIGKASDEVLDEGKKLGLIEVQ